jgi:hypothetical protein
VFHNVLRYYKYLYQENQRTYLNEMAALKIIDAPMLTRVWQELEYHIYVCCVTHGAHIEHL